MQSLKKNWLVVSNMNEELLWIFTQPLKSSKKFWAKKYRRVIFHDIEQ